MWVLTGSVHLFTVFGIRVRAHASLIVLIALVLLFGGSGVTAEMRVQSMTILFIVILLHEFGHCFAARWEGGDANEIIMSPLGGLAMAMAPRKPWPTFVTVAAGPAVNVLICLVTGIVIYFMTGTVLLGPYSFQRGIPHHGWFQFYNWFYWTYAVSYALLIFNLIPVFPLDGGQMLQAALWKPLGYYKSMMLTMNIGLVGSVLMFMVGIATWSTFGGGLLLMLIAVSCFISCFQTRALLRAEGPWGFQEEDESIDYSASIYAPIDKPTEKRAPSRRAIRRAEKLRREEASEQEKIDAILAKVSAQGMQSLSWLEKRTLRKATENQRKRDLELARSKRAI
jgi:Zn-dependent protease